MDRWTTEETITGRVTIPEGVVVLRQAFAKGYRDIAHMLKDSDFDGLRSRDDYAALLWDLAGGTP